MIIINRSDENDPEIYVASDMDEGDLFYDSDGDLHLRLNEGCLMFTDHGAELLLPVFHNEEALAGCGDHSYFNECTVANGEVTFTVDLKKNS